MRVLVILAALLFSFGAKAATNYFDISNKVGFQANGAGGIFGNGIVALTPIYTVGFGDTVDFGTAHLFPDPPDGRTNCFLTNNCYGNYSFEVLFTTNGTGGLASAPFDISSTAGSNLVYCPNSTGCPAVPISLLFALPGTANGIQFVFEGGALSIEPPPQISAVPEPSTWTMMLVGLAGLGVVAYRRKSKPALRLI